MIQRLASALIINGISQGLAAFGLLIGIRILTGVLSPTVFGEVSLLLGIAALATTTLLNPTMQALLRYFPVYEQVGDSLSLRHTTLRRLKRISIIGLLIWFLISVVCLLSGWLSLKSAFLLLFLMVIDGMRLFQTTILNASSQHLRYGIWQVGEAWGRPLMAYVFTAWFGMRTEIILGAFIFISAILYALFSLLCKLPSVTDYKNDRDESLMSKFAIYSKPLIPLGLIGWVSGMADRYMIGGLLSVNDAGLYVAAYGLASRPMLMLSTIVETAIRPAYYETVGRNDFVTGKKCLSIWFSIVVVAGAAVCTIFAFFHHQIAKLLLGPEFRDASHLMPWIAIGYSVCAVSHIPIRVCYANEDSRKVLLAETAGAVSAVVIGLPLIYGYGLVGAAIASPIYFGFQLLLASCFAFQSSQRIAANAMGSR